jgi:hypothetical protein
MAKREGSGGLRDVTVTSSRLHVKLEFGSKESPWDQAAEVRRKRRLLTKIKWTFILGKMKLYNHSNFRKERKGR